MDRQSLRSAVLFGKRTVYGIVAGTGALIGIAALALQFHARQAPRPVAAARRRRLRCRWPDRRRWRRWPRPRADRRRLPRSDARTDDRADRSVGGRHDPARTATTPTPATASTVPPPAATASTLPTPVATATAAALPAPAASATPPRVPSPPDALAPPATAAERQARCTEILQKASLERITAAETNYFKRECK